MGIRVLLPAACLALLGCMELAGVEKKSLPAADAGSDETPDALPDGPGEPDLETLPEVIVPCLVDAECDDGIACTEDHCFESGGVHYCANPVSSGRCHIRGECVADGLENPDNECLMCRAAVSQELWSGKDNLSACGGGSGICCGGLCIVGGACCEDEDCGGVCEGSAADCSGLTDQAVCASQDGCGWVLAGSCGGTRTCEALMLTFLSDCLDCGCSGLHIGPDGDHCTGENVPCGSFVQRPDCEGCGCPWTVTGGACEGTHRACEIFPESVCAAQAGCAWRYGPCTDYQCP
jgi:hypothetical protein